jgi:flagellin-specific chaperone FliS
MLRISQASPAGLVVISLEIIVDYLNEAANSPESFRSSVQKAKEGIEQLIQSLDFEIPLSQDFYDIYNYCYKLLCDVHFSRDTEAACAAIKEVREHMETLLTGWRDAEEKSGTEGLTVSEAVTANEAAPKVYTGLTYGRDGQAQEYIDENKDRGYMA